jgi:putative membrane protein
MMIALAATSTMLAACANRGMDMGAGASADAAMAMPTDMTPEERTAYVRMAAASDLFEIQSSQLALQRAQTPAVKQYAQMLLTHHTQTTQQLMAAAAAAGLPPITPQLMPMQVAMLERLQRESGSDFDRVFIREQVPAHEMALALHDNYAMSGDTPALRQVAATARPLVEQHLMQARQMNR